MEFGFDEAGNDEDVDLSVEPTAEIPGIDIKDLANALGKADLNWGRTGRRAARRRRPSHVDGPVANENINQNCQK